MAVDHNSSGYYLFSNNLSAIDSDLLSVSIWIWPIDAWASFLSVGDNPSTSVTGWVFYTGASATDLWLDVYYSAGATWRTMGHMTASTWNHLLITFDMSDTANDPVMYVNGVSQTVFQQGSEPVGSRATGWDSMKIGGMIGGAEWGGYTCELAIWDKLLSADDATVLALGALSPLSIKLTDLIFYNPLYTATNATIYNYTDGVSGARNDSFDTDVEHPPVQQAIIPVRHALTAPEPTGIKCGFSYIDPTTGAVHYGEFESKELPVPHTVQVSDAAAETSPSVASLAVDDETEIAHPIWRRDSDGKLVSDEVDDLVPGTDEEVDT